MKMSLTICGWTDAYNEQGVASARGLKISVTSFADHVFNNDYILKTINEVECFIKANKHLPEIPSEADVVNHELDVGQMQTKLLEKIEELTLYVIDLQKQIDFLKGR